MLLSHLKYLLKESGIDCPCQAQTKQTGLRGDVGVEVRLASFIFHVHHIHWQILDSGLEHQTLQLDIGLWTNRLQTVSSETSSTVVLNAKAQRILLDNTHPSHSLFTLLLFGKQYKRISIRLQHAIFP